MRTTQRGQVTIKSHHNQVLIFFSTISQHSITFNLNLIKLLSFSSSVPILLPLPEISYRSYLWVQRPSFLVFLKAFIGETIFSPLLQVPATVREWHSPSSNGYFQTSRKYSFKNNKNPNNNNKKTTLLFNLQLFTFITLCPLLVLPSHLRSPDYTLLFPSSLRLSDLLLPQALKTLTPSQKSCCSLQLLP